MSPVFKQPVSVLVVIHTPQLDVLLMERAQGNTLWQSVTGSREGDESLADTARREVAEETGIQVPADALTDWRLSNRFAIMQRWRGRYAPGATPTCSSTPPWRSSSTWKTAAGTSASQNRPAP